MKKRIKLLIIFLGICILGITSICAINAENNDGKITLEKTATKMYGENNNLEYGRKAKIELSIKGSPYKEIKEINKKLDIVLIFDGSKSMETNRLDSAKEASKDFANSLMDDGKNVKIGIIEFGKTPRDILNLTDNKNEVLTFIKDKLSAEEGTNLSSAIEKANDILTKEKREDAKQIVIILTDGIPTYFTLDNEVYGKGNSDNEVCINYIKQGKKYICTEYKKPSEVAKEKLDILKTNNNKADVYTIVFGNEEEATNTLAYINKENQNPLYQNYNALTGTELKDKFKQIIENEKNIIATNLVVTDQIPDTFTLTNNSKQELLAKGIIINNNTLIWTSSILENLNELKLSYEVEAKDSFHGSMFTNISANLKADVEESNPYYNATKVQLEFNKPSVEIPQITKDDHYSNNKTYISYEKETLNGSSILTNDLNQNKQEDTSKVSDSIIIIENDNTKKNENGTYNIYKDNILQGLLTIKEDGSFKFIPERALGEIIFSYKIKTKIKEYKETEYVYSNTSKVTLNIKNKKTSVSGTKTWKDDNNRDNIRPSQITVVLTGTAEGKEVSKQTKIVTKDDNWNYTFNNINEYYEGKKIIYKITEEKVENYTTNITGYDIENTHNPEKINITGEKVWVDNNNTSGLRPETVTVNLLKNDQIIKSETISKDNNWIYSFKNLLKYENGKKIEYSVTENKITHYTLSYDKKNPYILINTYSPKNINISGTKTWIDENNKYGRPESVTIKLIGKVDDTIVLTKEKIVMAKDNWQYSFENLPEYNEGKLVTYYIDEEQVKDYDKIINNYDITNKYNPETINITGKKTWIDNDNQDGIRPEVITIHLYANGIEVNEKTITKENNWEYSFENQVKYANGKEIKYTLQEEIVPGYTTKIIDYNIENNHAPETVSFIITKKWNDYKNISNLRPKSITVHLFANNKEIAKQVLNNQNNWKYSFLNYPKYEKGNLINYQVVEDSVKGYKTSIKKSVTNNNSNIIITNTYTPKQKEIKNKQKYEILPPNTGIFKEPFPWFIIISTISLLLIIPLRRTIKQ